MPILGKYDNARFTLLRAEALCADLLDNGFSFDNLVLRSAGSFRKSFRSDFTITDQKEVTNDELEIVINRDGLYDRLPEGLFHQTRGNSKTADVEGMVQEHRRFKEEEKHARRFFQPIEQEFYRFAVMVEQEERTLSKGLYEGSVEKLFYEFWDISSDLPAQAASRLSRIMPWAGRIKGNMQLTARALELVIGKPVSVERKEVMTHYVTDSVISLGESELGVDSVTGAGYADFSVNWIFSIGNVDNHEIVQYLEGEPHGKLLQRFDDLFIPLGVDSVYQYELVKTIREQEQTEWVLGYSLTI